LMPYLYTLMWQASADVVSHTVLFEDDGLQTTFAEDRCVVIAFTATSSPGQLELGAAQRGIWTLPYGHVRVVLPDGEKRVLLLQSSGVQLSR
jgi:hypothetical protein